MTDNPLWDNSHSISPDPPPEPMATRPILAGVVVILAVALGAYAALSLRKPAPALLDLQGMTVFSEPRPLPALALQDDAGETLGPDYFDGHWTLVFFGFTNCPDVCPTTLATLAQAYRSLTDLPAGQRPRVLFISVDPERDDRDRLGSYVDFFDPGFSAATGTPDAIAEAAAAFGVPYAKVPLPNGGYTMDHGSGIFVVGPDGLVGYASGPHEARQLAENYRRLLESRGSKR
jgi:protein SCO1/2